MSDKIIWLTDRSRTVLDWSCPRKRYWNYHYKGKGVTTPNLHLELFLGTAVHDGLAAIATQWMVGGSADIDLIATTAGKSVLDTLMAQNGGSDDDYIWAREQSTLVEGLLRGFYRQAWPSLISQYPQIIAVEEEMTLPLSEGIVFMSRPDLVLADSNGNWVYVEYKTTSSKQEAWVNQWTTAVQVHSTIRAIEATLGQAPTSVVVQGLYKGYLSYGKQSSPFCYGYYRQGTPPFSYPETLYEYRSGFKRVPVWEMDGGIKAWVENMPERVLQDQFPQTPPIYLNDRMIDQFFHQRLLREVEIMHAMNVVEDENMPLEMRAQFMDGFFPQRFDQCNPAFGSKACSYKQLCFGGDGDPLETGWIPRQPHHLLELQKFENEGA